jgi:hypothetical protein
VSGMRVFGTRSPAAHNAILGASSPVAAVAEMT